MARVTTVDEQEQAVLLQAEKIKRRRADEFNARARATERRIASGPGFDHAELVYSAGARCRCGAGLAYPDGIGMHGAWYCSAVLALGGGQTVTGEHDCFPFSFYSIRGETQIARNGGYVTTRPSGAPVGAYVRQAFELENKRRAEWEKNKTPLAISEVAP